MHLACAVYWLRSIWERAYKQLKTVHFTNVLLCNRSRFHHLSMPLAVSHFIELPCTASRLLQLSVPLAMKHILVASHWRTSIWQMVSKQLEIWHSRSVLPCNRSRFLWLTPKLVLVHLAAALHWLRLIWEMAYKQLKEVHFMNVLPCNRSRLHDLSLPLTLKHFGVARHWRRSSDCWPPIDSRKGIPSMYFIAAHQYSIYCE